MRGRTGKGGRDEGGGAIHLRSDYVQLDVEENLSRVNRVIVNARTDDLKSCWC